MMERRKPGFARYAHASHAVVTLQRSFDDIGRQLRELHAVLPSANELTDGMIDAISQDGEPFTGETDYALVRWFGGSSQICAVMVVLDGDSFAPEFRTLADNFGLQARTKGFHADQALCWRHIQ